MVWDYLDMFCRVGSPCFPAYIMTQNTCWVNGGFETIQFLFIAIIDSVRIVIYGVKK